MERREFIRRAGALAAVTVGGMGCVRAVALAGERPRQPAGLGRSLPLGLPTASEIPFSSVCSQGTLSCSTGSGNVCTTGRIWCGTGS